MGAMITFAAYMIMRPCELFVLDWEQVDLDAGVVHVERRLYRRRVRPAEVEPGPHDRAAPPARRR